MWKGVDGEVLYVGKAKSLRRRVASYLRPQGRDRKTSDLMALARDLDTILTRSEREALLLEATLIRKHRPRFNIALKDDRRHAWIRVDMTAPVPSFQVTRDVTRDGARYFGPYGSTRRVERIMDTVRRTMPVATCASPESVRRPCLDHHLGRCAAPCVGKISHEEYRRLAEQMCMYLDGRTDELIRVLRQMMTGAAARMDYEAAAVLRDRIADIEAMTRHQRVYNPEGPDRDVLGIAREGDVAVVELLMFRHGRLLGTDSFPIASGPDVADADILTAFVEQFYFTVPRVPSEIVLPTPVPQMDEMSAWLAHEVGHEVRLLAADNDTLHDLVDMASTNARHALGRWLLLHDGKAAAVHAGVRALREALALHRAPVHIEGFDIADIHGTDATGSCVVFRNGEPDPSSYRMFRVRTVSGPDDYAMMREVVLRRYRGLLTRGGQLPDLVLVDGGLGQLGAAMDALQVLGLDYLPVAALAKKHETVFTADRRDGIVLPEGSPALRLLQHIRDEAHRFARRYHHKLRAQRVAGSVLEMVPGIGPRRRAALFRAFGSVDGVRRASLEELASVDGMTLPVARRLREWLDAEESSQSPS